MPEIRIEIRIYALVYLRYLRKTGPSFRARGLIYSPANENSELSIGGEDSTDHDSRMIRN
jgi:hypothetical protein